MEIELTERRDDDNNLNNNIFKENKRIPYTSKNKKQKGKEKKEEEEINKEAIIKKRFTKFFFSIFAFFYLKYGRDLYILSLKGCSKSEFDCLNDLQLIKDGLNNCITSTFYFIFILYLIQMGYCSIIHFIFLAGVYIELIIKDHDENFLNHGLLNLFGLFSLTIMGEIVILIILFFRWLFRKGRYIIISILIISFIIYIIRFIINNKDAYYCKDWDKGLNGTYINNDQKIYPCKISIPKEKCLIGVLGSFVDFSRLTGIKCEKRKEREKTLLKSYSNLSSKKEVKRIGYPITIGKEEEINGKPTLYAETLYDFVKDNLVDMDDKEQLSKLEEYQKPEVIVNFNDDPYGKIEININYKEQLTKKRKALEKPNTDNVLFLFIDNLSRAHFYRQYKKTSQYLKQFLKYEGYSNEKSKEQKYHGFEFLKYHKLDGATVQNALPMFSGVYLDQKNTMVSILRDFKKNGYITGSVQDVCHKELMYINPFKKYTYIEFDHEYAATNCEPNIYNPGYGMFSGENGIFRKCLYGKESFDYGLEYGKKFWETYKNNKRFLRIVNTYAHDYSSEKSKYTDESTYNFLKELFETDQLKNTTVFIAADHGFALMGIYKILGSNDYPIEYSLPLFILIVPDKKNTKYEQQYSEILKNQQTMITPFDIFYTLRYILYGEKYKNAPLNGNKNDGEYLFKRINPKERVCKKYKQLHKDNTCRCKDFSK